MDIFPRQAENFRFMEVYKQFVLAYRDEYYNNRKLPHYNCYMKNPESTFLIFLPYVNEGNLSLGNFMNGIVYVNVQTYPVSNNGLLSYKIHVLPFQDSDMLGREQFFHRLDSLTPYHQLEQDFAHYHYVAQDDTFESFNQKCVFQLQPEHYHYFEPFFKEFAPYRRLAQRIPVNGFLPVHLPRNSLL